MLYKTCDYEILTPSGWSDFDGVKVKKNDTLLEISFNDGKTLTCTKNHKIKVFNKWCTAEHICVGDQVNTYNGFILVISIKTLFDERDVYDALAVKKNNQYYTNGVISHNCEFLGSSNTLIDASKLGTIPYADPISKKGSVDKFEEVIPGHTYLVSVDTSRGSGIDYSAFIVFDITSVPYRVVAKYRDNEIESLVYPTIIYNVGRHYNYAYVLVEVNDIGQQVADILLHDLEYENVLSTRSKGRAGQNIGGGAGVKYGLGVRTTTQVKRIGCANFKSLVENDKIIINDYDLLYEMFRFIEHNNKYEAEEGEHDDLVMCCVLFSWLVHQEYFKELCDNDARLEVLSSNQKLVEENLIPFGFIDDVWVDPDAIDDTDQQFNKWFNN